MGSTTEQKISGVEREKTCNRQGTGLSVEPEAGKQIRVPSNDETLFTENG